MYLKSIRAQGFKSFADKLDLEINPGITGIVGPNGSGKSNIVDAVRWVLGEQSVKSLRGANSMSDVIFSGSESRDAQKRAMVALTFDNTDKYLHSDFNEVEIKRIVYSSGENEYYINNSRVRLKDITDLFIDSGAGSNAFNIISQGNVTDIVNSKPGDRRVIFESAAGVLKYKRRKEESLKKLEKTQENLTRIKLIITELAKTVEPLKEQSVVAKKYKEIKSELENIDIALIVRDINEINSEYSLLKTEIDALKEKLLTLKTSENDAVLEKIKLKNIELEDEINAKREELVKISDTLNSLNSEKQITLERQKYEVDNSKVDDNLLKLKEQELTLKKNIDVATKDVADIESSIAEERKKGEDVKVVVSWGRGDFQKAFDEVLNGFKNYIQKTGDMDSLLIMGGDLNNDKVEGQKVKDIAELLTKDPLFKGRVMLLDDFAPGEPMALMADTAIFPSRTAPCELTDLEAKKMLCTPITANGQGLGQKNFDPAIADEAKLADAFKTKHQYFDSREDMLKSANEDAKNAFNKVYNKIKNEISTKYKTVIGGDIPEKKLELFLDANEDYKNALRKLRDSVMADDIAECLERCLITHRNDDVAKTILKNQANIKTGWENNQVITRSKVPTGELYRQQFKKDAHDITREGVIGSNVDKPGEIKAPSFGKLKQWFKAHKKSSIIAGSAVVLAGLGYAGYKGGWLSPKFATEEECDKKPGHLSRVV